jgi:eukaryotic-like serine/threonine-protein kinase
VDGRFLLERASSHRGILCLPPGESRERHLEWLDQAAPAALSEDGSTILFGDRSESEGLKRAAYLRRTDGSPPIRLGDGTPMSLSPDGKWALLLTDGTPRELVLQPTGSGSAKKVPVEGIKDLVWARFLPDGKRIAVSHFTNGKRLLLSIVGLEGGKPQTVETKDSTPLQGVNFSPDGTLLAYATTEHKVEVVPIAGGSPRPVPGEGLKPNETMVQWSVDGRFLFISDTGKIPARVSRLSIETGERTVWKELQPADVSETLAISNIVISRDGRSYAYNYWETTSSDLYVVEGLK